MDRIRATLGSLVTLFSGLPRLQQFAIVGAVVGVLGVMSALFLFAQQPEMVVVFKNVDQVEAAQIVNKLKETKTPYELTDNGMTISVPSHRSQDVRLEMASAGLPKGGSIG